MTQRSARQQPRHAKRKRRTSPTTLRSGRDYTEKKEGRVAELDAKIDRLYAEKNDDRMLIRELSEKITALEIENLKLTVKRCDVKGCPNRQPPSDY